MLRDLGLEEAERATRIADAWPEVVGDSLAAHSRPVALHGGVLDVLCEASVWSQQLTLRSPEILGTLRERFEPGAPRSLRLLVGSLR